LGGGAITGGETRAKYASGNGPLRSFFLIIHIYIKFTAILSWAQETLPWIEKSD
jgi:hypothetical protein